MYTTLISAEQFMALQRSGRPLMVFDCSFELMQPAAGLAQYREAHVPGAIHADLDTALSAHGRADAASGGRHPLPNRERFAAWLGSVGFGNEMQAVVYDRQRANYCGRLWWMLKWAGHEAVAVLDGGLQAWIAAGGAVESGDASAPAPVRFTLSPARAALVGTGEVSGRLGRAEQTLIDARAAPRFRGETEPLDPVAGHIPGALNRPFGDNLDAQGKFKPAETLRAEFEALLSARDPGTVVHHCGSGVSAVPNVIAMELAGLGRAALYAGSWSEWSRTPGLPCAQSGAQG
ncbi:MAG: Thiosulfate sulfurtransferase, rhodanese [Burkholderiaceae bacterium]|nr:MAG: Thiosulfate sulfurtransferase, rhodanese [Burkholderiaceae bacterium]